MICIPMTPPVTYVLISMSQTNEAQALTKGGKIRLSFAGVMKAIPISVSEHSAEVPRR